MTTMTRNGGAQWHMPPCVDELLSRLIETVEVPGQTMGRPRMPLPDVLFGLIYKACYRCSYVRAVHRLRTVAQQGLISRVPSAPVLSKYMADPAMTPILRDLVSTSSLPLKAVENDFHEDSMVLATSRFLLPGGSKVSRTQGSGVCLKVQAGRKTGVVGTVEIAKEGEVSVLPSEASPRGSVPYGSLRAGFTRKSAAWQAYNSIRAFGSVFGEMKRRYGGRLRARSRPGQVNELYCMVIAHNLSVLVHEMFFRRIDVRTLDADWLALKDFAA